MESSVHRLSPWNTYSFEQGEISGLTRKLIENYLLFMCTTNQFLAPHPRILDGLEKPFSVEKKVLPAQPQQVFYLVESNVINVWENVCIGIHLLRIGWRNYFSAVIEKFLQPINAPRVYGT